MLVLLAAVCLSVCSVCLWISALATARRQFPSVSARCYLFSLGSVPSPIYHLPFVGVPCRTNHARLSVAVCRCLSVCLSVGTAIHLSSVVVLGLEMWYLSGSSWGGSWRLRPENGCRHNSIYSQRLQYIQGSGPVVQFWAYPK